MPAMSARHDIYGLLSVLISTDLPKSVSLQPASIIGVAIPIV